MNNKVKKALGAVALLAAVSVPAIASADMYRDPVYDFRGDFVKDFRGNCVLTNWAAANDVCAGGAAAASQGMNISAEGRNIYFDFDSAELTSDSMAKLDAIAKAATSQGRVVKAQIVGHADPIGNQGYNQALSARRAMAVKNYLASKGYVNTQVMSTSAVGESRPAVTNCGQEASGANIACQQPNRRVEIIFDVAK
jgi:outer membrane protein OmpA-like peptidoglycan-associated protein